MHFNSAEAGVGIDLTGPWATGRRWGREPVERLAWAMSRPSPHGWVYGESW